MARTYTVHSVMWHSDSESDAYAGAAGDGSFIARFASRAAAEAFAVGRRCYGQPATVATETDVPRRLAERWGLWGLARVDPK